MENRFLSENDFYEVLGQSTEDKALKLSMEFFRYQSSKQPESEDTGDS